MARENALARRPRRLTKLTSANRHRRAGEAARCEAGHDLGGSSRQFDGAIFCTEWKAALWAKYVDGQMLDVGQVDVLRGLRGILFGRNSTGRAINITSVTPDDETIRQITAEIGNESYRMRASYDRYGANSGDAVTSGAVPAWTSYRVGAVSSTTVRTLRPSVARSKDVA